MKSSAIVGAMLGGALVFGAMEAHAEIAVDGSARFATGSYYGGIPANDHKHIDVGFQPDVVIIKGDIDRPAVVRTATMPTGTAKRLTGGSTLLNDRVRAFDATGFVVGNDYDVNKGFIQYHWVAIKGEAGEGKVGSYVGNGADNRNLTGPGLKPSFVLVIPENSEGASFKNSGLVGTLSCTFGGGCDAGSPTGGNKIQALQNAGFQVGNDATVNAAGTKYHYVALKAVDGKVKSGYYAGNGQDDRLINSGFSPGFVLVTRVDVDAPQALWRQLGGIRPSGDKAINVGPVKHEYGIVRKLGASGIRVSPDARVNANDGFYVWTAINE